MLNIYLDYSTVYNYNISFYEEQNHAILCNAAKLYSKVFNLVKALKGRLYGGFNFKCGILSYIKDIRNVPQFYIMFLDVLFRLY